MVAPERDRVESSVARAAESLLRSLVGVSSATVNADRNGRVAGIVVVPSPGTGGRQLARNVASALMARFGMTVDPSAIIIRSPDTEPGSKAAPAVAGPSSAHDAPQAGVPLPEAPPKNGNGHGDVAAGRHEPDQPAGEKPYSNGRPAATTRPQPAIEIVELTQAASGLRCRVVVRVGSDQFVGIGDAPYEPAADVELAARVTVDALRAARVPTDPIQFDGATIVRVAGQPHAVTAISFWTGTGFERRSGAEPVTTSMAEAAARSVIRTVTAHLGEQS